MFSATEDDDLFNISANPTGSNLASLFGASLTSKHNDSASLVYTAPKTPKTIIEEMPKAKPSLQSSSVICTAFVETFAILSDKTQKVQGKCGLAVIGNQSLKAYEVIIYKSKQDIIMRTKLKSDFTFILQDNNFASFYDDEKQQWSVRFNNGKEINNFVDELKKCGANISHNINKATTVETKVDTEITTETTSDSSSSQTKANILSRMAKMGQSILPSSLPLKPDLKSNASDSETDEPEVVRKPIVKKRHKITGSSGDSAIKSNGQPSTTPEYLMVNGQLVPISSLPSTVSMISSPAHSQLLLPNHLTMNPPQLTSYSDPLNIFIAENRTHNCELRMNMTQIFSKLDSISAKIDKGGTNAATESVNEFEIKIFERDQELARTKQSLDALQKQYDILSTNTISNQKVINDCELEINNQMHKITELTDLLNEQTLVKVQQENNILSLNETVDTLKLEMSRKESYSEVEKLNHTLKDLQEEITKRTGNIDLFDTMLKQSMNILYQEIMANFNEEYSYLGTEIRTVLSQKLKTSTISIIQEFNSMFKEVSQNLKVINPNNNEGAPPIPEFNT